MELRLASELEPERPLDDYWGCGTWDARRVARPVGLRSRRAVLNSPGQPAHRDSGRTFGSPRSGCGSLAQLGDGAVDLLGLWLQLNEITGVVLLRAGPPNGVQLFGSSMSEHPYLHRDVVAVEGMARSHDRRSTAGLGQTVGRGL